VKIQLEVLRSTYDRACQCSWSTKNLNTISFYRSRKIMKGNGTSFAFSRFISLHLSQPSSTDDRPSLQYQSTLRRPDIPQPYLTTGSECSFHRTSTWLVFITVRPRTSRRQSAFSRFSILSQSSHPADDIPTSLNSVALGEHHDDDDDDDVGAKSWRLHWKSSIGKQNKRGETDASLRHCGWVFWPTRAVTALC
jgi:hypothetical protein